MLQDIFVDDLLGDPQDIERVEGEDNEYLEDDERENEQTEDAVTPLETDPTGDPVQPKAKRTIQRPQPKLNAERLKGPRGVAVLEDIFKGFKFHGKGHEKRDLNRVMKYLEHWAHRLYPRLQFDDCLEKIETLGHKKPVMVYVKKIRMGLETAEEPVTLLEDDNEIDSNVVNEPPIDPFDALIEEQLSITESQTQSKQSDLATQSSALTAEQRERMIQNRLMAEKRKLARLKAAHEKTRDSAQISSCDTPSSNNANIDEDQILLSSGFKQPHSQENNTEDQTRSNSEGKNSSQCLLPSDSVSEIVENEG